MSERGVQQQIADLVADRVIDKISRPNASNIYQINVGRLAELVMPSTPAAAAPPGANPAPLPPQLVHPPGAAGSPNTSVNTPKDPKKGGAGAPPDPDLFGNASKQKQQSEKCSFADYEARCIASKQPVIPNDHAVFAYIENIELPDRYCQLAYFVFERTYRERPSKRYIDWPRHFHNAVRGNWFRLWRVAREGDERWTLTTEGVQAELEAIAAGQLAKAA